LLITRAKAEEARGTDVACGAGGKVVRLKKRTSEGGGRGLPGAQAKGKTRSGGVGGGVRSAHGEVEKRDVGANVCVLLPLLLFSFLYCLFFYGFFFNLAKKKKRQE
jgi:hypothetical protein